MTMDKTVFVVLDTKGAGRIVGVFEREVEAEEVQQISPGYYRLTSLRLNEVNPECVRWAQDDAGRAKLERLSTQIRAIPED
jgi:hypothetical protein